MTIYLYHKRHQITGLNYFGKTTSDPYKYTGSGVYWNDHCRVHGYLIETVQVWEFNDYESCREFAIDFSLKNNIVEARDQNGKKVWANLIIEDGKQGGNNPHSYSPEASKKRSQSIRRTNELKQSLGISINHNTPERVAKAQVSRNKTNDKKRASGLPLASGGQKWYNNGLTAVLAHACPPGFVLGRGKRSWNS